MNLKEIIDNILNEEEGGEFLRFNNIKFYISGRTEGKNPHLHFRDADRIGAIRLDLLLIILMETLLNILIN